MSLDSQKNAHHSQLQREYRKKQKLIPKILQTFYTQILEPSVNSHVANNDPKNCNVRMKESLFSSQSVIFIVSPCARSQMHLFTNRNCYQTTPSNSSDIWRPVSGIDVWCSRRVNLTLYGISLNMICCPPTRLILSLITQI